MKQQKLYILGGHQSDFARNWGRESTSLYDNFADTLHKGLQQASLDAADIEVGHVGNFVSDAFTGQAHLGGFFAQTDPALQYVPASRHEAACASGSMAIMAAMSDLESGRYSLACVMGIEIMRNVDGGQAAENLRGAAWVDKEWQDTQYVWPCAFNDLLGFYQERYDLDKSYLRQISQKNYQNARLNPNSQSRNWTLSEQNFDESSELNPSIYGNIHRADCGQITDGCAVVFIANQQRAQAYAETHGLNLDDIPYIKGWGHVNAPIEFTKKQTLAEPDGYTLPHVKALFDQTLRRAGMSQVSDVDCLEVHDCFNITEYMILDHSGLQAPGEFWKSIEAGDTQANGKLPVNLSGGLIGSGHPVGATGVRMLLDAYKQISQQAGDYQCANAQNAMTVNIGGSTTTCASFIVGR